MSGSLLKLRLWWARMRGGLAQCDDQDHRLFTGFKGTKNGSQKTRD